MLVTSRETKRWIIPKGWPEKKAAPHELAAREAYEEAGVRGKVGTKPIGSFRYEKRLKSGRTALCDVDIYLLRVEQELTDWPERRERERQWFRLEEAAMAVEEGGLVTLLLRLAAPNGDE